MGLVGLLRVLWRRRIVVGVGAVLAIAAAVVGIQRGADATPTSSSLTKVLIDTPKLACRRRPGQRSGDHLHQGTIGRGAGRR